MTRLNETGNYSCVASNKAGTDTKYFLVTIVGKIYFPAGATMKFLIQLRSLISLKLSKLLGLVSK